MSVLSLEQALALLKPLAVFVLGMALYAVFVFKFYRFLGRRDIFSLDLARYNYASHPGLRRMYAVLLYMLEHLVILPLMVIFWFAVLVMLLSLLSREQALAQIMLMSIAVVSAVRVTAYYEEDLSKDLAKILPFAILGFFLIDITYFKVAHSLDTLKEITTAWTVVPYYLLFVVGLELVLRLAHWMFATDSDDPRPLPKIKG